MKQRALAVLIAAALVVSPAAAVQADTITQLLKLFGVGYAVRAFAPQLNAAINTLTFNHGVGVEEETKVVPILTVGSRAYIGAAQVSGPKEQVERVQAVAQFEGAFFEGVFRVKGLVPVDSVNPADGFRRVDGVGISALLDLAL